MEIRRAIEFDMAHRLPNHEGKCRRLHGHRYRVEVMIVGDQTVNPKGTSDEGMVIDFAAVDRVLDELVGRFDHYTMLHFDDPLFIFLSNEEAWAAFRKTPGYEDVEAERGVNDVYGVLGMEFVPTAENLAQHWFDMLWLQEIGVCELTVWETPKSSAACREPSARAIRMKEQQGA